MTTLVTPRLSLSIPTDEDRADFRALSGDPLVMRHFPSVQTAEESDALVARSRESFALRGFGLFTVRRREDGGFVGFVGLGAPSFDAPFMPCVEVGWRLVASAWGQGYATEAAREALRFGFEDHALHEIVSFTAVVNEPSRRVMERLGMRRDPAEDFDHPRVARGHRLERHVLYRLRREDPRGTWQKVPAGSPATAVRLRIVATSGKNLPRAGARRGGTAVAERGARRSIPPASVLRLRPNTVPPSPPTGAPMSDKITTSTQSSTKNGNGARNGNGHGTAGDLSLRSDVKGLGTDVKAIAGDVAREAQRLAELRLDSGKGFVAEGFGSVAGAIRNTGDQLRQSPVGPVSGYLGDAADSIRQASKYLENKSVGEVVSDVEDFARREPLIFLGGTFAVGLLLGRFLKASAPEQRGRADRDRYDAPPPPRRESFGASASTGSSSMGGSTTGGNMGAGKLPSFDSPMSNGPITNGPITTGPVSTESSVGTDLPVEPVAETIIPLRTTGTTNLTSSPRDERDLGEKKPTSVIGSAATTGGTTSPVSGGVKKTDV